MVAGLAISTLVLAVHVSNPSRNSNDRRDSIAAYRPNAMPHLSPCHKADLLNATMLAVWPANRVHLRTQIIRDTPQGLLFVEGAKVVSTGNSDAHYPFVQDSNFQYLSGVNLPDCLFFIDLASSNATLFISPIDPVWVGRDYSLEHWARLFNVNTVYQRTSKDLTAFLNGFSNVTLFTTQRAAVPKEWTGLVDRAMLPGKLLESRLIKTPEEVAFMRIIVDLSADAHVGVMQDMKNLQSEYATEALFLDHIYSCLLDTSGYQPIVGHGYNSAILHYDANEDKFLKRGELVLIDAAGAFRFYTGDITRTYPTSGVFSPVQAGVYNAVLAAQIAAEKSCGVGVATSAMLNASRSSLFRDLQALGFIAADASYSGSVLSLFLPHGISHTLGLDVHDDAPMPTILQAGVVFTIEPGVYFNQAIFTEQAYSRNPAVVRSVVEPLVVGGFGGVRIEDDYLVTADGCQCLSCGAPRTIADIERVMREGYFQSKVSN